jgi:hypothetical protein
MIRAIYAGLLRLHPRAFRERYASEMMLIFEERAQTEGYVRFLVDGLESAARQWIRRRVWVIAPAAAFALLEFFAISKFWHDSMLHGAIKRPAVSSPASPPMLWYLVLFVAVLIVLLVGVMAFRMQRTLAAQRRSLNRRRCSLP